MDYGQSLSILLIITAHYFTGLVNNTAKTLNRISACLSQATVYYTAASVP